MSSLPALDNTLGAAFIGLMASAILFGVSNLQVYIYYHEYTADWIVYKVSVAVLWALDAFNLALAMHALYYYLVSNFGYYPALGVIVWSFKLQTTINVVIVVFIQSLYCLRLWKLNQRNAWIPRLVPILVVIGLAIGIALIVKTFQLTYFDDVPGIKWASYSSFASAAGIDFAIAGAMIYYLRGSRSEFATTNSRISSLILWTLSTGILTSFCSLAALITLAAMPDNLVFIGVELLLTKLYFNSMLAMLNARKSIRERGTDESSYSVNLSNQRAPQNRGLSSRGIVSFPPSDKQTSIPLDDFSDPGYGVKVKVQTTQFIDRERGLNGSKEDSV